MSKQTTRHFLFVSFTILGLFGGVRETCAQVTFDWATVGNPGNDPDQDYGDGQFGAVDYTYRISKHEVTNDQYPDFLNAVDPMGTNPNDVYHSDMRIDARGGIDFDAGAASGSKYSSKTNMGNKPVNYVSFFDAMRFTNWLENGQPTDGSGTETGVYTIGNGVSETRAPGATFFIPSEDEWYKAAYSSTGSSRAATRTTTGSIPRRVTPCPPSPPRMRSVTSAILARTSPTTKVVLTGTADGNVTTVGTAGAGSASFYGTFDQGGNVWEWNEAVLF